MGTEAHIVAVGGARDGDGLVDQARRLLQRLDARWTRFSPRSELSRLNASSGRPVVLAADTFDLVSRAVAAWHMTNGLFDPTVHDALVHAGYDRTFARVAPDDGPVPDARPAPGCGAISLWPDSCAVLLPAGVRLDLGGIGKGYAADLVATTMIGWGASGACVNIGGDVRVTGAPPAGTDAWVVAVDGGSGDHEVARIRLAEGAVVTTTPLLRQWRRGGHTQHHLIDPRTGAPANTGIASVTVVGADASWSEVFAKAAYLAGLDGAPSVLENARLTGVVVADGGRIVPVPGIEEYLECALT